MTKDRAVILYIAMSLDGFIADKNGGIEWLSESEGEGDSGYSAFYDTVDTLIMGRTTYDQILSFGCEWPYSGKTCYVYTNRMCAEDDNVTFVRGDIPAFVQSLKSRPGSKIWLVGGAHLINSFLKSSLIDEYSIAIIPVILGDGIRLFERENPKVLLRLLSSERFGDICILHYVRQ